jgi:hypothetical protein
VAKTKNITKKLLFAKTIEILQPKLNLSDWRIIVRYSRVMKTAIADCQSLPEYKQATIRLSLLRLPEYSHYEIISTAVHEMLHCIVWRLTEWTEDLCKKDTQKLQVTRRLDEGVITHLEKVITDMVASEVQSELLAEGYGNINLLYNSVRHINGKPAKPKVTKKTTKKTK